MQQPSVTHGTFVIERTYSASAECVFAALADPAKKRRWFVEEKGLQVEEFETDFRVGGRECARYRFSKDSPFPGATLANYATFQDIVPNRRVVLAYTMTLGDKRISASQATFELLPSDQGTDLIFTDQGAYFEGADGPQIREEGWRKLLENLAKELTR